MALITGINPWLAMWNQPRHTIRALVHNKPSYGVFYLATLYALQSFFFYSNWWSLGLHFNVFAIFLVGVAFSPLMGFIWLYYAGFLLHFTGRWLKGQAPASHLRAAIAWSKIPYSIQLLMWIVLIFISPHGVFIQGSDGSSSIFVNLISAILGVWSLVLLIQGVREVQQFTVARCITNVFLAWLISSILLFLAFSLIRYIWP